MSDITITSPTLPTNLTDAVKTQIQNDKVKGKSNTCSIFENNKTLSQLIMALHWTLNEVYTCS